MTTRTTELDRWAGLFESGPAYAHLCEVCGGGAALGDVKLPLEHDRAPDVLDLARSAWHRLGRDYLASRPPGRPPCWAEGRFGRPWNVVE